MKIAVLTLVYNEETTIGAVIKNWEGLVDKHLVLHTNKPWHGKDLPPDRTEEIVKSFKNTEFIRGNWIREHDQRNFGLGRLYDYDYVLIVDADELYTREDAEKIVNSLGKELPFYDNLDCYRVGDIKTYFKNLDYALDPADTHQPVLALNPKKVSFTEVRIPSTSYQIPIDVTLHHLTYCRQRERLVNKLEQFEHWDGVKSFWMEEKFDKWTPDMEDVRAYGHEKSKAIFNPAPQEIKDLIIWSSQTHQPSKE